MAIDRLTLLLLLCLYCETGSAEGHTKVWTMRNDKFINFGVDDSDCINQTLIYQKEGGIYFNIPEEINTIILPTTGVIMFRQNQEIKFKARQSKCHSDSYNSNHFKLHMIQPMSWFDSNNWRIKDTEHQNKATPHIDRIPCECDDVEFSTNHSLWIDMDYMPQWTVNQVKIDGRTDDFRSFVDTSLGQSMFMFDRSYGTFQEGLCTDTKSCGCHDPSLFSQYLDAVCINSEVCHEPNCLDPIQPIGHCCPICGAAMQVTVDEMFCMPNRRSSSEYMDLLVMMQEEFAGKVDGYMGMVRGDHDKDIRIQMIAVEKGEYTGLSVKFIKKMSESKRFNAAMNRDGTKKFVFYAGRPHLPNRSFSIWLIVFSSLLLVLSMFGTIYIYYSEDSKLRKYNPFNRLRVFTSPFVFARFDNTRDDDAQSIAVGVEFEEPQQPSTSIYETFVSAFDNPMFKNRNKEKKIETIGPNVLNSPGTDGDDGESVASVKLVEVGLDSSEES